MSEANQNDTPPTEALWVRFAPEEERHFQTVEYRTPDQNTIVHVYLNQNGALCGIEIFP
jgi:uncharacterized protein YuzE